MKEITVNAHAKINLSLDVCGIIRMGRYKGYHEVDMILHLIGLHDRVQVGWEPVYGASGITIRLNSGRAGLSNGKENLAYQAAQLMAAAFPSQGGTVWIRVEKDIPVAAGLAGGSGNGAAVLLALNHLWQTRQTVAQLAALGETLGADVPFSVMGLAAVNPALGLVQDPAAATCARATGIGTSLEPLPAIPAGCVLSKPDVGVSTAAVYRGLEPEQIRKRPDVAAQAVAIRTGDLRTVRQNMVNVLENVTCKRYDNVVYTKNKMQQHSHSSAVMMSGSGPTVFAWSGAEQELQALCRIMKQVNQETCLTATIGPGEEPGAGAGITEMR